MCGAFRGEMFRATGVSISCIVLIDWNKGGIATGGKVSGSEATMTGTTTDFYFKWTSR